MLKRFRLLIFYFFDFLDFVDLSGVNGNDLYLCKITNGFFALGTSVNLEKQAW